MTNTATIRMSGNSPFLFALALSIAAAILCAMPSPSAAGAVIVDPVGLPVCAATGDQLNPRAVPAANGAAIIVWQDKRRGGSLSDIYALSIAANGTVTAGWPDDGRVLCPSGLAGPPMAVPDGSGGALVLWRDGSDGEIHAQRVNADGTLVPGWPVNGKSVTEENDPEVYTTWLLDVLADGAGGAYFARVRAAPLQGVESGTVSRITPDGTVASGWTIRGLMLGPNAYDTEVSAGRLAEDPGSGVFYINGWVKWPGVESYYGASVYRISSEGGTLWGKAIPHNWDTFFSGTFGFAAAAGGNGACFTTWANRSYQSTDEFVQRYSPTGDAEWLAGAPSPTYQHVERDGAGGGYLIGGPYGVSRLEVHRIRADGSMPDGWTAAGITLSTPTAMGVIARGTFGDDLFLCWSEKRSGGAGFDVRAAPIDSSGVVVGGWAPDGTIVSDATGDQTAPAIATMSPERMLVCWQDTRTGGADIRATRIEFSTVGVEPGVGRPSALALGTPWPNPARGRTTISLSLPERGTAALEIVDVGGRTVRNVGGVGVGEGQRSYDVNVAGLANGVYWLRLSQAGRSVSRRIAVLN
jgi:hypothetical protein